MPLPMHRSPQGFQMCGRLHDEDYSKFVPLIDSAVKEHGSIRLLAQFHDFHGWDPHALWDDIKFSSQHCHDVERIALVGDKKWERWMADVCKPFTKATIKYFDIAEEEQAWEWLEGE